jgi:hypothetical protein
MVALERNMDHATIWKFTGEWKAVLGTPTFEGYTTRHLVMQLPGFETEQEAIWWAKRHPMALDRAEAIARAHEDVGAIRPAAFPCIHYRPYALVDCDECSERGLKQRRNERRRYDERQARGTRGRGASAEIAARGGESLSPAAKVDVEDQ